MQVPSLSLRGSSLPKPFFASGFCNSTKRVSKSLTISRKCSIGIVVRSEMADEEDRSYMRRCVEIARKAVGCTSPNPMVGCVIVNNGEIVGEGFHPKAGQPHAEVFGLRDAGELAENATAYVSLEPCNHHGRTPPCTEALIKARVKRVVVGMVDPNPIVASKGVDRLRNAGIEVTVGVETELCESLNEPYIHQMLTGKPLVTLRYSLSVNGQIVDQLGEGAENPGGYYSRLLQEYDAVIVSAASIAKTSSIPKSQERGANQPLRIVAASNHNSPVQFPDFLSENTDKLIIFGDKEFKVEPKLADKGIETVVLDRMSLDAILEHCKRQGFCSVLIDLRGNDVNELLREGFERRLIRKVLVEVLPVWVEDESVILKNLSEKVEMKKLQSKLSGNSVLLEGSF